jgi:hypothetical protein
MSGLHEPQRPAPLPAVLLLTGLCSLGTGVFWTGTAFIARHTYGFEEDRNLMLYAMLGGVYAVGALNSGRLTRLLERWVSARSVLGGTASAQAAACLLPVTFEGEWALWLSIISVTWLSSILWPIVESYVTAGRHGAAMRSAIGWFNLTWAPCAALPLFLIAPLVAEHGRWAIGAFSAVNGLAAATVPWFTPRPAHHDPHLAVAHVAVEYPLLLRSVRFLLPLSYVLTSAMSPILPYRFEALGVATGWQTPATGTWPVWRLLMFLAMWRLGFWHGRWGTLLSGGLAMGGGFGLVVAAPNLGLMLVGLALLGAGVGAVYYAALYYAMAVGHAAVDAGGVHEGLIGIGYGAGPLAGLAGKVLERGLGLAGGVGIVGMVWGLVALGCVPALLPYLHARRRRHHGAVPG